MRPRIDWNDAERLKDAARDVDDDLPDDRDIDFPEALASVLDYLESDEHEEEEDRRPDFQLGTAASDRGGFMK